MSISPAPHDLFLSCVSSEFHHAGGGEFGSYRLQLADVLAQAGFHVAYQETFAVGGGTLLQKLEDGVRQSKAVIHLVGDMVGALPKSDEVDELWARHPDFLARTPQLRTAVGDGKGVSYTQWEALLAVHFDVKVFCFRADDAAPRSPRIASNDESRSDQRLHWERIRDRGTDRGEFVSCQQLILKVLISLHREGIPMTLVVRPNLEAAYGSSLPGREAVVERMINAFMRAERRLTLGFRGLGGVGKTRLVTEVGHGLVAQGKTVLFVKSISSEPWSGILPKLAQAVGLPDEKSLVSWMQDPAHRGWVLILDGMDRLETFAAVRQFVANYPHGHVLVTTRLMADLPGFSMEVLAPLDAVCAERLVANRFEWNGHGWPGRHAQADRVRLFRELGCLPLACEQAAVYLCEHPAATIPDYLGKFLALSEDQLRALFAAVPDDAGEGGDVSAFVVMEMPVARTWRVNFDAMSLPEARTLLRLFSFMSDDPIPDDLLRVPGVQAAFAMACRSDPFEKGRSEGGKVVGLEAAYQELHRFGFVMPLSSSGSFWIHRLVLYFTRIELEASRDASFWPEAFRFLFSLGVDEKTGEDGFHHDRERFMSYPIKFLGDYLDAQKSDEEMEAAHALLDPHLFSILDALGRLLKRTVQLEWLVPSEPGALGVLALSAQRRANEEDSKLCIEITRLQLGQGQLPPLDRVTCWSRLADCYFWQQHINQCFAAVEEGWRCLAEIPEDGPKRAQAEYDLLVSQGWVQRWCGDCEASINSFDRARGLAVEHMLPDYYRLDAQAGLASSLDYAGRYKESLAIFHAAMEDLGTDGNALMEGSLKYLSSWVEIREGDRARGLNWCEEALVIGRRHGYYNLIEEGSWILAIGYGLEGRWQEGLELLQGLEGSTYGLAKEWIDLLRGIFLYRNQKKTQAASVFQETTTHLTAKLTLPDATQSFDLWDTVAFCHVGLALYGQTGHAEKARAAYQRARELSSAKGIVDIGLISARLLGDGVDEILGVAGSGGE